MINVHIPDIVEYRVAMDPRRSAQDLLPCDLCLKDMVQKYCDICHVRICRACVGEHIEDNYDKHKVVPYPDRKSTLIYPKCRKHKTEECKFHCKECDMPVCSFCGDNLASSDEHKGDTFLLLSEIFSERKADITKDSEEIENAIAPTYEEMVTNLETDIANLDGNYAKLTSVVTEHGEDWHKEIDNAINIMKNEIEEMKIKHLDILKKHLDEIKQIQSLIEQSLITLREMEKSNEVSVTTQYRSRNEQFRKLPPKVRVSLPTFTPSPIDGEQLYKSLGCLMPFSVKTDENGYPLKKTEGSPRELMEEPELVTTVNTGYEHIRSITSLSEEEFWTSAEVGEMKCFNVEGTIINTIKTKSGKWPNGIAMTGDGELVYADGTARTVYKVKSGQTEEVIRLQGWVPGQLCVTSSGDLLVTMYSEDKTQAKVVRYSGSTENQTIQYDDEGQPLYSGNDYIKFISENRNQDICVPDHEAGAVVVVNQAGKLRFRYTGPSSTTKSKPFKPRGITTDSQSQILTADYSNHCIHILDQSGQFLRYIDNCHLKYPRGLCVDKSDNLYVAEYNSGNIKKIKYLKCIVFS
jgi:streptogramin lyase